VSGPERGIDQRRLVGARRPRAHGTERSQPQRVWTLHKGEHAAAIDLKAVAGIGAEMVLTVDGELRKTRLFRSHEQAGLVGAIADARMMFEEKGGNDCGMRQHGNEGSRAAAQTKAAAESQDAVIASERFPGTAGGRNS
jgi:hypothetical protein